MSSAAVQHSMPQQYDYDQTSQGHDRYPGIATTTLPPSSPPSSRHAGRAGSTGNASLPNSPQQSHFGSTSGSAAMSTSRTQNMGPPPPAEAMASSTYTQFYPDSSSSSMPNQALPIRTSSRGNAAYDGSEADRTGTSDSERRRQYQSAAVPNSSRSQRQRPAPETSRSSTAVGQLPVGTELPRENSAIINRIVVDDPNSDMARESARTAEARPQKAGEGSTVIPGTHMASSDQDVQPQQRSRQEHLRNQSHKKEVKFGDYILGATLGEGEFGKVKIGYKRDSTVQVAIKLIRKESLAGNATRLPKIYREIAILRELQHPNIVRLHEFVETERHMGIILEYASGGELFDFILNQRYLKDPAARRLFAQLVSGVGYLHKKGIVHRDLKLENLLLDRNRNIIITDFGFANTFNPADELGEDVERRIQDKDYVKRERLDQIGPDNHRRGDLMQTSCGSPCYAAPELVVSDGLYTGRKVDVWSCGVILYAMLAGYLPFDDDPANPEGDNINLLYKYIVSTPLTFPEYVTPHARDLLRRILVPDPRRRADLFEVARHSWLSEFSHVVGFIGSSTKSDRDIATSALQQGGAEPALGRSASVREPGSRSPATMAAGGPVKPPPSAHNDEEARARQRDAKRRTVQVEYVAPQGATTRGDAAGFASQAAPVTAGRTKARGDGAGPVEVTPNTSVPRKELPSHAMPPPSRPGKDQIRAASDFNDFGGRPPTSSSRPATGGARLPSRGNSYSQPAVATPTTENAHGRFSQPKPAGYIISSPMSSDRGDDSSRPVSQQNLSYFDNQHQQPQNQQPQQNAQPQQYQPRGHKRSSTLGSIGERLLGRSNSRRSSKVNESAASPVSNEKRDRRHPPVSMRNAMPNSNDNPTPRPSSESKRRPSFTFGRKNSDVPSERRSSRRFSFLPGSFSISNMAGGKKDGGYDSDVPESRRNSMQRDRRPSKGMAFGRGESPAASMETSNSTIPLHFDENREATRAQRRSQQVPPQHIRQDSRYEKALPQVPGGMATPPLERKRYRDDGYGNNARDNSGQQDPVERYYTPQESLDRRFPQSSSQPRQEPNANALRYQQPDFEGGSFNQTEPLDSRAQQQQQPQMRSQHRKFGDAYDNGHAGSSSGARRVMDFFRRRGKDRSQA
ncbi:hypothetical protein D0868_13810 [Hortaea werneckii]|uniref:non-specific serine/threonine protein kinase n=2 Tax=Hortaea werneckii TaxID=91943 RepID=A0A3M6XM24_HORWE|nr:hypothetical protein D0868_13810 [Hortaea werneckii]